MVEKIREVKMNNKIIFGILFGVLIVLCSLIIYSNQERCELPKAYISGMSSEQLVETFDGVEIEQGEITITDKIIFQESMDDFKEEYCR